MTYQTHREKLEAEGSPAMLALADAFAEKLDELGHHDYARRRALLLTLAKLAEQKLVPASPPPIMGEGLEDRVRKAIGGNYREPPGALDIARACATVAIEIYGDFDEAAWAMFKANGIWNDHAAVQSALVALRLATPSLPEGMVLGFDAAVAAIETWAAGFTEPSDTASRLRLAAKDLRRNRDTILAHHPVSALHPGEKEKTTMTEKTKAKKGDVDTAESGPNSPPPSPPPAPPPPTPPQPGD